MSSSDAPLPPTPPPLPFPAPRSLRERIAALGPGGGFTARPPFRLALSALLLAAALVGAVALLRSAWKPVRPGEAGLAVNTLTGRTRLLPPGSHFLPSSLYDLHLVRVSDQLLGGPAATFGLVTRDGITVSVSLQARFAVDRERLLASWASLPRDPGTEVVAPVLVSSFRSLSTAYDAAQIAAEKREELAAAAAVRARQRLEGTGIVLRDVLVSDLGLPRAFSDARMTLLAEQQAADRKDATLKVRQKEIEEGRLVAEAEKVRREKAAETEAAQRLIAARAEADAMQYILPLKEKEIRQRQLEAEAQKAQKVAQAEADAQTARIQTEAEASRRRALADAEAYAIRATSQAKFENLRREVELVQANPVWVSQTFAEKISDKVQVILTPQLSSSVYTDEVLKRLANGKPAVAAQPPRREPAPEVASATEPGEAVAEVSRR